MSRGAADRVSAPQVLPVALLPGAALRLFVQALVAAPGRDRGGEVILRGPQSHTAGLIVSVKRLAVLSAGGLWGYAKFADVARALLRNAARFLERNPAGPSQQRARLSNP